MSTATRLEEVRSAITAVLLNQSYTLEGQTVTRANLESLIKLEQYLEGKQGSESGKRAIVSSATTYGA